MNRIFMIGIVLTGALACGNGGSDALPSGGGTTTPHFATGAVGGGTTTASSASFSTRITVAGPLGLGQDAQEATP